MDNEMTANIDISAEENKEKRAEDYFFRASAADFKKIPGSPIAYWVSDTVRTCFKNFERLGSENAPRQGMATSDNNRFLRLWHEVSLCKVKINSKSHSEALESKATWFPYNKGGKYRRWYGNNEYLVNWKNDGEELIAYAAELYGSPTRTIKNIPYYFKPCATWSFVSSSYFGVRYSPAGFLFDVGGSSAFCPEKMLPILTAFLCSKLAPYLLSILNPTLNFQAGTISNLPFSCGDQLQQEKIREIAQACIAIAKEDWDTLEISWNFSTFYLLVSSIKQQTIQSSCLKWNTYNSSQRTKLIDLEQSNNKIFLKLFGLENELSSSVNNDQITLVEANNDSDVQNLISYAIGCMMGRYSLDEPGLIYAHSGNEGFDSNRYTTFPADDDGIVPVMDMNWFDDDASKRFEEFLKVAWNEETLEENLKFVADSLAPKRGEEPRETIRRFISTSFFKDHHLRTYKKRPIYWFFSSGKNKAFECLVYLHRYNESTLSRMRSMYVTPLQGKFNATIEYLQKEKEEAPSTSTAKSIQKQLNTMLKKQEELRAFDELLRHYADQRISLDLDDGVKVNYGKFGKLLAEVKAVTGEKAE
ncbi:MAG: BREX-1 system adenine-specific DNA-methyltransferase PglX [Desulfoplanes sp.]